MRRRVRLLSLLGWLLISGLWQHSSGQFAQSVLHNSPQYEIEYAAITATAAEEPMATKAHANSSSLLPNPDSPASFIEPDIQLPACPFQRLLSTVGVPANWKHMTLRQQVAEPVNALMVQLAYIPWQDNPKETLGKCLHNLGIDLESVTTVHKAVLPYFGTMTAVVMRAGGQGVFVSFRGTDFDDAGDVLVDADCQHTEDKGRMFGSSKDIRLHTGFYRAWESVAPIVLSLVEKQLQMSAVKKVYLVGHSLGASMASIAALRLNYLYRSTEYEVAGVWLYGCPRVGNSAWMQEYNKRLLTRTVRMANYRDFASRLPMNWQVCTSVWLIGNFEFRHIGRAVVLCPDASSGLAHWNLYPNGTEVTDCSARDDTPDFSVMTHWLGAYLDAWRRAHTAAVPSALASSPYIASVMCQQCSLSFPNDRAKQLNVPARAGGPVACCTTASCSQRSAWEAVAGVGSTLSRSYDPASTCDRFICT